MAIPAPCYACPMETLALQGAMRHEVLAGLERCALFARLTERQLDQIIERAKLVQYEAGEVITVEGEDSHSFFVLMTGEASVVRRASDGEKVELARLGPYETVGEVGVLLREPRSATVQARDRCLALRFEATVFDKMFERVPEFGLTVGRALAARLVAASRQIPVPEDPGEGRPSKHLMSLLPIELMARHRVLPVEREGEVLRLGFVEDPSPSVIRAVREVLPGLDVRPVRISAARFDAALRRFGGVAGPTPEPEEAEESGTTGDITGDLPAPPARAPSVAAEPARASRPAPRAPSRALAPAERLDPLLRRMVAEGASDLHLSPGRPPRWRIDGEVYAIEDAEPLAEDEAVELLAPAVPRRNLEEFTADGDTDFAYAIPDLARFRVNVFREAHGAGAVLRQIPARIRSLEDLGLPDVVTRLCDQPKGLVLVTGPTGSGKSTTLAAMIDRINRTRRAHVITLEDPIEFMHSSEACLVNQREVGSHTRSFARALRAALREDPDIVLVGEMRDLETIALALEVAQTGHLVFATLHTSTAASTVDRIIDIFPSAQQPQIRTSLAEVLRGVVAQTLLRRQGGGRVAAVEVLVATPAVSNLVREGKTHQLVSAMQTGRGMGMRLLNEQLFALVRDEVVEIDEAMAKAVDKHDLAKRLGLDPNQL